MPNTRSFFLSLSLMAFGLLGQEIGAEPVNVMVETSLGDFVLQLDADRAPLTVANFLRYVDDGFYTGTVFHRVVSGFVIQGGGYTSDMTWKTPRAPIRNESGNGLSNRRGTVAMARMFEPDSAASQFYINLADNLPLDPKPSRWGYTVFGRVVQGFQVVDYIGSQATTVEAGMTDVPARDIVIRKISVLTPASRSSRPEKVPEATSGSCFFVSSNGKALTSYHVVQGAKTIFLTTSTGERVAARIASASEAVDLAVLEAAVNTPQYLSLAPNRSVTVGMKAFTYGYPATSLLGAEPKFTDGTVSALSGIGGEQTFLQVSVPVQPGNSGGPLVNEQGEVIGIIAAQAAIEPFLRGTGTLPQNVNWAVKAEYASLLTELPPSRPTTLSREKAIERVRNAICFVEAD